MKMQLQIQIQMQIQMQIQIKTQIQIQTTQMHRQHYPTTAGQGKKGEGREAGTLIKQKHKQNT